MHWPQITVIVLIALRVGVALAKDGEPRKNFSFWATVSKSSILSALLYAGGFFG